MSEPIENTQTNLRRWRKPGILVAGTLGLAVALAAWKSSSIADSNAAAANQQEPAESVAFAIAQSRDFVSNTTAIGTVVALRSITVRNEIPGTVRRVNLIPGTVVEAGTVLVALDVSVESAELQALEAQAKLAGTQLERMQRMVDRKAASAMELDAAQAQRDVAVAQIARTQAVIARKTIRAPFRARIGISDVHEGQYLNEGTQLTTLQGVDQAAYVDFTVTQQVAATLQKGTPINVFVNETSPRVVAQVLALDSRVDSNTRNTMVRARIANADQAPSPGASVRVEVPVGASRQLVGVPASAVRKGPGGDHVFVLAEDDKGAMRAQLRTVTVEALRGDEVVLSSGLEAGERVAASGAFKLRESALVALAEPKAPDTAGGPAPLTGGK